MARSIRVFVIAAFVVVAAQSLFAAPPPAPELDPGSIGSGLVALGIGSMYLIERFRRRR